jgi:hypothetical protein
MAIFEEININLVLGTFSEVPKMAIMTFSVKVR